MDIILKSFVIIGVLTLMPLAFVLPIMADFKGSAEEKTSKGILFATIPIVAIIAALIIGALIKSGA